MISTIAPPRRGTTPTTSASPTRRRRTPRRPRWASPTWIALALLLGLSLGGCEDPVEAVGQEVLARLPHDTSAFTQGLLYHEGRFYESTGLYGHSTLREVVAETGEVVRSLPLDSAHFGEGLARVGSRLIQLTWKSQTAFVYDLETFEVLGTFEYFGQGWGLCHDGTDLFHSRGDATLVRRDPETFQARGTVEVTREGGEVGQLNELECARGVVYANVYGEEEILRIDPATGRVTAVWDLSSVIPEGDRDGDFSGVMNGIAYEPESGTFFVTGKNWPAVFRVRLPEG